MYCFYKFKENSYILELVEKLSESLVLMDSPHEHYGESSLVFFHVATIVSLSLCCLLQSRVWRVVFFFLDFKLIISFSKFLTFSLNIFWHSFFSGVFVGVLVCWRIVWSFFPPYFPLIGPRCSSVSNAKVRISF